MKVKLYPSTLSAPLVFVSMDVEREIELNQRRKCLLNKIEWLQSLYKEEAEWSLKILSKFNDYTALVKESEGFLSSDEVKEFRDKMMETFNACMLLMNEQQRKLRKAFFDVTTELARLSRSV